MGTVTWQSNGLVHWPLMGGLLHLVQRGGAWAGCVPVYQLHMRYGTIIAYAL